MIYVCKKPFYMVGATPDGLSSQSDLYISQGQLLQMEGPSFVLEGKRFYSPFLAVAVKHGYLQQMEEKVQEKLKPEPQKEIPVVVKAEPPKAEPPKPPAPPSGPEVEPAAPLPEPQKAVELPKEEPKKEQDPIDFLWSQGESHILSAWNDLVVLEKIELIKKMSLEACSQISDKSKTVQRALEIRIKALKKE